MEGIDYIGIFHFDYPEKKCIGESWMAEDLIVDMENRNYKASNFGDVGKSSTIIRSLETF